MNNRNYHCMPMAGQVVNSSLIGYISHDAVMAGATTVMRQVAARGIAPSFFDHVKGLSAQPLGDSARQLNLAHCEALADPLANATPSAIEQQTGSFATSIGMHAVAPKPAMSLPKKKGPNAFRMN